MLETKDLERLRAIRHSLHAHPELSRQEFETAKYLRDVLAREAKPDRIIDLQEAGFAAIYEGTQPGKTVMLRTELDALPIQESNTDLPYCSKVPGVGHKCGHDGHMAMIVGVAFALAKQRPASGRVVLIFQPDEETGTGAKGCVAHPNFSEIQPDQVFALHNLPGVPFGQIVSRAGTFASAVHYEAIRFTGRSAHSAQPHTGASPAKAIAELTLMAESVAAEAALADGYALAVPIYTRMGVASSGVAPSSGEIHLTLRSDQDSVVEQMLQVIQQKAEALAKTYDLFVAFETLEKYDATVNQPEATLMIEMAANLLGKDYVSAEDPFRWGEDFGAFTALANGAMFGLGSGLEVPPLHDQAYDFPDELILEGVGMFLALVRKTGEMAD